jgi:hypothetical protein
MMLDALQKQQCTMERISTYFTTGGGRCLQAHLPDVLAGIGTQFYEILSTKSAR